MCQKSLSRQSIHSWENQQQFLFSHLSLSKLQNLLAQIPSMASHKRPLAQGLYTLFLCHTKEEFQSRNTFALKQASQLIQNQSSQEESACSAGHKNPAFAQAPSSYP